MKNTNTKVEILGHIRQAVFSIKKAINVKNKQGNIPNSSIDELVNMYTNLEDTIKEIRQFSNTE